jgi:hypothetical protein
MNVVARPQPDDGSRAQPAAERPAVERANVPVRPGATVHQQQSSAPVPALERARASIPKARTASAHNLHWPITWGIVVATLIVVGAKAPLERYITPQRGLGYWLGIIGGSMMLLLLVYSARKRVSWLRWMGGIPQWFQFHMALGVVGPLLVLYHCNFRLGSTNSNVALMCMLLVAGSGVVGRYIYTRIHANLDGKQDSLEDLQAVAEKIRTQTTKITFLPGLLDAIDREQQRLVSRAAGPVGRLLHVITGGARAALARWRLHRLIRRTVAKAVAHESQDIVRHTPGIAAVACRYADRRLDAGRRVAEYRLYARLFSFWHVLHIPLFFMLLIAAVAHVIAVNIY